uniref:Uncharacterized protein n=1 Tax=Aegilops tauschii subsp. strangulata TaxID=200361 RepID=A0A453DS14_AEGTS
FQRGHLIWPRRIRPAAERSTANIKKRNYLTLAHHLSPYHASHLGPSRRGLVRGSVEHTQQMEGQDA